MRHASFLECEPALPAFAAKKHVCQAQSGVWVPKLHRPAQHLGSPLAVSWDAVSISFLQALDSYGCPREHWALLPAVRAQRTALFYRQVAARRAQERPTALVDNVLLRVQPRNVLLAAVRIEQ
eukprot:scaffold38950_cov68-Phaeocystis_antarctica.AAC.4